MPKKKKRIPEGLDRVVAAFDRHGLAEVCEMDEELFAAAYGMETVFVNQKAPSNYYHFKDNGSSILAVAHLDTVVDRPDRICRFLEMADGTVVYSGALDDRLGAYTILEWLPAMGITYDVLLTVGEESGMSTASFFESAKQYDYIIEFDRGGCDVVMYQYDDLQMRRLVRDSGARVGEGSFSDISYLEHLGVKAFNWGIGYQDYHGPRSHAYLDDTFKMVAHYLKFHEANAGTHLPHLVEEDEWADEKDWRDYTDEETRDWWAKYRHQHSDDVWAEDTEHADNGIWSVQR